MAVLVEALSVILKIESIEQLYNGGWKSFSTDYKCKTLCNDSKIARIGFMTPASVGVFIDKMTNIGMKYAQDGKARDMTVADQIKGPLEITDWLDFVKVDISETNEQQIISTCQHINNTDDEIMVPNDWVYEGSLSQEYMFIPNEQIDELLEFIEHNDGVDTYIHKPTGKLLHLANQPKTSKNQK